MPCVGVRWAYLTALCTNKALLEVQSLNFARLCAKHRTLRVCVQNIVLSERLIPDAFFAQRVIKCLVSEWDKLIWKPCAQTKLSSKSKASTLRVCAQNIVFSERLIPDAFFAQRVIKCLLSEWDELIWQPCAQIKLYSKSKAWTLRFCVQNIVFSERLIPDVFFAQRVIKCLVSELDELICQPCAQTKLCLESKASTLRVCVPKHRF